jgi:S-formylglutathione hydrolase FrmB
LRITPVSVRIAAVQEGVLRHLAGGVWALLAVAVLLVIPAGTSTPIVPVLPPDAASFGVEHRTRLAESALLFHPADDDRLGDGVFTLPLPLPWPPGAAQRRSWELNVPSGAPLFLVVAVSPGDRQFTSGASVVVDGVPVKTTAAYAVRGLQLSDGVGQQEYSALAVVIAPPAPGRHTVTASCNGCAARHGPWMAMLNGASRTYVLNVGAPAVVPAPSLVLDRTFFSPSLGRKMSYLVYLPPGYGSEEDDPAGRLAELSRAARRYPVLFLLHGLGEGDRQWSRLGLFEEIERQIAAGGTPAIAVLPTGSTGYWVNHAAGGPRFGDYVVRDLVDHVDATYRTLPQAEARAIGGISMGGHGALQLSLNHPGVFGAVGAHSPALRTREQAPFFMGGLFPGTENSPGAAAYAAADPISLVRDGAPTAPARLWIDTGQQDIWATRVQELHGALQQRGWAHSWQPAPGAHQDAYWQRRLPEYVRYYLEGFAQALGQGLAAGTR